jgi:hypothetical protein
MSNFEAQNQSSKVADKCKNPHCIVPQCGYQTCSWSIMTQTCTTCHLIFDSISTRAKHSANCKPALEAGFLATKEPENFCGCCYQYFATEEQYYTHKSECSEEYGMQLMAQEHYEDEDGWREYEYEQEYERMEDFRQTAIAEAVCRRCQRYFHVCKCN